MSISGAHGIRHPPIGSAPTSGSGVGGLALMCPGWRSIRGFPIHECCPEAFGAQRGGLRSVLCGSTRGPAAGVVDFTYRTEAAPPQPRGWAVRT